MDGTNNAERPTTEGCQISPSQSTEEQSYSPDPGTSRQNSQKIGNKRKTGDRPKFTPKSLSVDQDTLTQKSPKSRCNRDRNTPKIPNEFARSSKENDIPDESQQRPRKKRFNDGVAGKRRSPLQQIFVSDNGHVNFYYVTTQNYDGSDKSSSMARSSPTEQQIRTDMVQASEETPEQEAGNQLDITPRFRD